MAAITPFLDAKTYVAKYVRRAVIEHVWGQEGVLKTAQFSDPLKVQAQAAPNMTVKVNGGDCVIDGDFTIDYGYALPYFDADTASLAIAASDPTNPRIDIVVVRVYDDGTGGGSYSQLEVVTGTPAPAPAVPATPANSYKLAEVYVGAGVTSITNANITDKRTFLSLPLGTLGYAQVVAGQGSITTEVDLTGLAVTVNVGSGRRIKITAECIMLSSVASDNAELRIKEGATQIQTGNVSVGVANVGSALTLIAIITPSAGQHTYKLSALRAQGTGSITMYADGNHLAFILVEDMGAA